LRISLARNKLLKRVQPPILHNLASSPEGLSDQKIAPLEKQKKGWA